MKRASIHWETQAVVFQPSSHKPKKARREPEAKASMPEVVPSSVEEHKEEEEEEIPLFVLVVYAVGAP